MKTQLLISILLFFSGATAHGETCNPNQTAGGFICDTGLNCSDNTSCPPNTHPRTVGDVLNYGYVYQGVNHVQRMRAWGGCVCESDTHGGTQQTLTASEIADVADADSCAIAPNHVAENNCKPGATGGNPCDGRQTPPAGFTLFQQGHYTAYLVRLCNVPSPGWGVHTQKLAVTTGLMVVAFKTGLAPNFTTFGSDMPLYMIQEGIVTTHNCGDVIAQVFSGVGTQSTAGAVVTMGTKSCVTGSADVNGASYCLLQNVNQEKDPPTPSNPSPQEAEIRASLGSLSTDTGAMTSVGVTWACPGDASPTPAPTQTPVPPTATPTPTATPKPSATPVPPVPASSPGNAAGTIASGISNHGGCGSSNQSAQTTAHEKSQAVAVTLPLTFPFLFVGLLRRRRK